VRDAYSVTTASTSDRDVVTTPPSSVAFDRGLTA
jgi:hypothetical protein